jgi:hypothetical protein
MRMTVGTADQEVSDWRHLTPVTLVRHGPNQREPIAAESGWLHRRYATEKHAVNVEVDYINVDGSSDGERVPFRRCPEPQ